MSKTNALYTNIFLLVPNLVFYLRFVLLLMFVLFVGICPWLSIVFLASSTLLDGLDGFLARNLNQTSRLGHILDYTIDRVTIILAAYVILYYCPQYYLILCLVVLLDISSHFFHLNTSHVKGKDSHKEITPSMPKLLKWYYNNRMVLFFTCFFHDLLLGFILVDHFYPNHTWIKMIIYLSCPGFVFKTITHIVQLITALIQTAEMDVLQKQLKGPPCS